MNFFYHQSLNKTCRVYYYTSLTPACHQLLCVGDSVKCTKVCASVYYKKKKIVFTEQVLRIKKCLLYTDRWRAHDFTHRHIPHNAVSRCLSLLFFLPRSLSFSLPSLSLSSHSHLTLEYHPPPSVFRRRSTFVIGNSIFQDSAHNVDYRILLLKCSGVKLKSFQRREAEFRRKFHRRYPR